jgi:hypothetical protein
LLSGDQTDPYKYAQGAISKSAKNIADRTDVHSRLHELGKRSEKEYEEFRIKQCAYCASSASLTFVILLIFSNSLIFSIIASAVIGALIYVLIDRDLAKRSKSIENWLKLNFQR